MISIEYQIIQLHSDWNKHLEKIWNHFNKLRRDLDKKFKINNLEINETKFKMIKIIDENERNAPHSSMKTTTKRWN